MRKTVSRRLSPEAMKLLHEASNLNEGGFHLEIPLADGPRRQVAERLAKAGYFKEAPSALEGFSAFVLSPSGFKEASRDSSAPLATLVRSARDAGVNVNALGRLPGK